MPGVPTSKGCDACRSRKKGCDLVRPSCGRCTKLGIKCVNDRAARLKFVDETEHWAQREAASSRKPAQTPSRSPTRTPPASVGPARQYARFNTSAIISHATGAFWKAYAPIIPDSRGWVASAQPAGWLQIALQTAHNDKGLDDAVTALALSRMSRLTGDQRARREALRFYGSCVQNVRKSIMSADNIQDDSLLATVMLLATFEIHEGTHRRDTAWGAHVDGASKLINARGAASIQSEFGRSLCLGHLRDELIYAVSTRGRSRRGIDRNTYLPFDTDGGHLDLQLIRILSVMPTIMEESDRLRTVTNETQLVSAMTALLSTCSVTIAALETFSTLLASQTYPEPLYVELPSPLYASLPPDSNERIFSEYLHFTSVPLASLQLTAWTSLVLLHSTLYLTWEHVRLRHPSLSIDTLLPIPQRVSTHIQTHVDNIALNIAQALEYFIRPESGLFGAHQIGFAIPVVMGYMAYWRWPEQVWFNMLFRRMKERSVGVEGFLADMFTNQELKLIRPLPDDGDGRKGKREHRWDGSVFHDITLTYRSPQEEEALEEAEAQDPRKGYGDALRGDKAKKIEAE